MRKGLEAWSIRNVWRDLARTRKHLRTTVCNPWALSWGKELVVPGAEPTALYGSYSRKLSDDCGGERSVISRWKAEPAGE